jgi:hypothetical protein
MTTLTIDRNQIDTRELFELHLVLRPGLDANPTMKGKRIAIGETDVEFIAQSTVHTNGVLLIWTSKTEWVPYDSGLHSLSKDDKIILHLNWKTTGADQC